MKKKICVVTGTRAEYGLLKPLIKAIQASDCLKLQLIATGTHLSEDHGCTINEIIEDGFEVDAKIDALLNSDSDVGIVKSLGLGVIGMADALQRLEPDLVVILGDRYEMLGVASAAMLFRIPIAHIHGGEKTEGQVDESIRHSISKMSHIHFVATEEYAKRVIQLGENPSTVFVVGGLGVDRINKTKFFSLSQIEKKLDFKFQKKNLLVTFHPVTLEKDAASQQIGELLVALQNCKDTGLIFTAPNADNEGKEVLRKIISFVQSNKNARLFKSLGDHMYLSCLKYIDAVVGNSSSGILEAPTFKIASINIGERQKGRLQAESIINCPPTSEAIGLSINKIYSDSFQKKLATVKNPYGDGGASDKIIGVLNQLNLTGIIKKEFYDLSF